MIRTNLSASILMTAAPNCFGSRRDRHALFWFYLGTVEHNDTNYLRRLCRRLIQAAATSTV